ncbi:MAG: DUF3857 domain-containing protein [Cytophagia bacterium]|nr:MAG: DUF3857 domain-containing protein [Cytophagales bacterium]TAG42648.1 MAG: DUF3857 domain-containing protein [Cytophagia bacterium]TAG76320.1 MAG: DUF3857 domain-containing protein [Cytophagales bacterium]
MKTYFISCFLVFLGWAKIPTVCAQKYPVSAIPDSIKANAHSVVRLYEESFEVINAGTAKHRIHAVITVLDARGQRHATVGTTYSKMQKINDMEAVVYDAMGQQVKRLRRADIVDVNYSSDGQLFQDVKVKMADLKYSLYPYTVETTYELTETNLLFYPSWFPQDEFNTSVESSRFDITVPANLPLRYKLVNGLPEPTKETTPDGGTAYSWQAHNLKARTREEMAAEIHEKGTGVYTAPNDFEIQGYKGSMQSWKTLGQFHYDLNKDRDALPVNVQTEVKVLVANEKDPIAKIKKLYEYMQSKTRYVGIQLGIGGWQTFEAQVVADKGYGDCKALSNYMKALLKAAGIPSFQALVNADEPDTDGAFPLSRFNHVILCVPQPQDTIWLECTSQRNPFGYLGDFTGDRNVLLLTPQGGKLVRTPQYKPNDNRQLRNVVMTLDAESGAAKMEVVSTYTGLQQDTRSSIAEDLNAEDQKQWLYKNLRLPSFEIQSFELKTRKDRIPSVEEKLLLLVRQCATKSGTRLFVTPNLLTAWPITLPPNAKRTIDMEWELGFYDADEVHLKIPTGYKVEYAPAAQKIETKFGKYAIATEVKADEVIYKREMLMPKGTYSAAFYGSMVDFFKKVAKADKAQVVLVKQ